MKQNVFDQLAGDISSEEIESGNPSKEEIISVENHFQTTKVDQQKLNLKLINQKIIFKGIK